MKSPSRYANPALSAAVALAFFTALGCGSSTVSAGEGPLKSMDTKLGKVLVDSKGMTLYTFDKDVPGTSNCKGKCANAWPPVMAAASAKPTGKLSIITRDDGSKQWAFDKMPLYGYIKDKKSGDVIGDNRGGVWHIVRQ